MRAEYDRVNNSVVAVEMDNGKIVGTNSPRVIGVSTEWLEVDIKYPVGYNPKFGRLLRSDSVKYSYDESRNVVVVTYPDADFSPAAIRSEQELAIHVTAVRNLSDTDYAVIESVELDKPIPNEIKQHRKAVRDKAAKFKSKLDSVPNEDVAEWDFDFTDGSTANTTPEDLGPAKGGDGRQWVTAATRPSEEGKPVRPAGPNEAVSVSTFPDSTVFNGGAAGRRGN